MSGCPDGYKAAPGGGCIDNNRGHTTGGARQHRRQMAGGGRACGGRGQMPCGSKYSQGGRMGRARGGYTTGHPMRGRQSFRKGGVTRTPSPRRRRPMLQEGGMMNNPINTPPTRPIRDVSNVPINRPPTKGTAKQYESMRGPGPNFNQWQTHRQSPAKTLNEGPQIEPPQPGGVPSIHTVLETVDDLWGTKTLSMYSKEEVGEHYKYVIENIWPSMQNRSSIREAAMIAVREPDINRAKDTFLSILEETGDNQIMIAWGLVIIIIALAIALAYIIFK